MKNEKMKKTATEYGYCLENAKYSISCFKASGFGYNDTSYMAMSKESGKSSKIVFTLREAKEELENLK